MKIGITFDLKDDALANEPSLPDDFQEEFDSPATIEAIAAVVRDLGHDVVLLGDGRPMLERVLADPPDFVFNIAEGHGVSRSREARVPAVMEMLGIPCSGSDPLTLAATLDKVCAKVLVRDAGVAVPRDVVVAPEREAVDGSANLPFPFPAIVKPAWEGSSKGIRNRCLVRTRAELADAVASVRSDHRQPVLIEEFVQGDEVTVGIFGNPEAPEILGIMRITPVQATENFVYSLEVKRDFRRMVHYECPPPYSRQLMADIREAAITAYRKLGCRDVSRVDFRIRENRPIFLEINPLPGLNPGVSDLIIMAELVGWTFPQLVTRILAASFARCGLGAVKQHAALASGRK